MELPTSVKSSKDVEFQDVNYTIKERENYIKVTGTRHLLRGISGSFRNGQLSAIMGPSGAGKSCLLNAISGYRSSGVTGHIKIARKDSCYITQEDNHQTLLSVEELMNFSCNLKLKNRHKSHEIITDILENLNLNHRRNITADKLSGGERKRLSIALELVVNPNIFFLDEPTSGLDEVTAAQCIRLLRNLAKQGRTIVCTIHQPSVTVFNYFDSIFVLAKGQCVYQGSPAEIIPFLRHVQLECPKYYSPSDFIIELCDSDDDTIIPILCDATDNGKLIYMPQEAKNGASPKDFCNSIRTLFVEEPKRRNFLNICSAKTLWHDKPVMSRVCIFFKYLTTKLKEDVALGFHQFWILFQLMILRTLRGRTALAIQVFHHILCGLCYGVMFFKSGNQGERVFDHMKLSISATTVIVYTQLMLPILSFPMEMKIVKKETFNRWYSLTPYYIALNLSRLPLLFILNLIFAALVYWPSGLPAQWWRFSLFASVAIMTALISESLGLTIGVLFNMANGSIVGALATGPLMGLAVYGIDFAAQLSYLMKILLKLCYLRVSVDTLLLTMFGFNRDILDCDAVYCHYRNPQLLLKLTDLENISMVHQFLWLTLSLLFYKTLLYLGLRFRCGTKS